MGDIERLIALVLADAQEKRTNAGYAGAWDDGGASRIEDQVKFYRYGQRNSIPEEWAVHAHKLDPEWAEYERLRAKFGGRK